MLVVADMSRREGCCQSGFTLAEVVVAIGITALMVGSLITGYVVAARRAEWTAMSEAAQASVVQRMEQVRMARWDLNLFPQVDELVNANKLITNYPSLVVPLFTPLGGTNATVGTNKVTIRNVSTNPPIRLVRVECAWPFGLNRKIYTNALTIYRTPAP
jgi:type II secretory pathway pseudopilin PulG